MLIVFTLTQIGIFVAIAEFNPVLSVNKQNIYKLHAFVDVNSIVQKLIGAVIYGWSLS